MHGFGFWFGEDGFGIDRIWHFADIDDRLIIACQQAFISFARGEHDRRELFFKKTARIRFRAAGKHRLITGWNPIIITAIFRLKRV